MAKQQRHLYEGMYILSATLSDDARQKALEKITSAIKERGGEILKIHEQGRRRLAYEIKGKKEGFYYILYFNLNPQVVKELWQEYHLNEDLMRFITLRTPEVLETIEFKPLVETLS